MDIYVKVEDGLYLNPVSGEMVSQARSSIPLVAPITVRKTKLSLKFVKQVGDVWIGSNKMSFALILAYVQLKANKDQVIGIYRHGDHHIFIEGSLDLYKHPSIAMGFTQPNETPGIFMSVRGKVYDGIFGVVEIKNIDFDFLKAHRELLRKVTPTHVVAILLCLLVTGYLVTLVFEKPKMPVRKVSNQPPPPPPPLSPAETGKLMVMLKEKFIQQYGAVQKEISASNGEKWLKSVILTTTPAADRQAIAVTFTYASFYPFAGAKRDGHMYIWTRPYGESLTREHLKSFVSSPAAPDVCLKYFINYPVTERTADRWTVSLKEDKYPRIVFLMNLIYDCPCAVKDMTIDERGLMGTVILDAA